MMSANYQRQIYDQVFTSSNGIQPSKLCKLRRVTFVIIVAITMGLRFKRAPVFSTWSYPSDAKHKLREEIHLAAQPNVVFN